VSREPVYLFDKHTTELRAADAVDRAYRAWCLYDALAAYAESLRKEQVRYPEGLPWGLHDRLATLINEASLSIHRAWDISRSVHGLAERPVTRPRAPRKQKRGAK